MRNGRLRNRLPGSCAFAGLPALWAARRSVDLGDDPILTTRCSLGERIQPLALAPGDDDGRVVHHRSRRLGVQV